MIAQGKTRSIAALGCVQSTHSSPEGAIRNFSWHSNPVEFDGFGKQPGLNSFILTANRWITATQAIGLTSKAGRYGGTFVQSERFVGSYGGKRRFNFENAANFSLI
jgi:hypothetical protein